MFIVVRRAVTVVEVILQRTGIVVEVVAIHDVVQCVCFGFLVTVKLCIGFMNVNQNQINNATGIYAEDVMFIRSVETFVKDSCKGKFLSKIFASFYLE